MHIHRVFRMVVVSVLFAMGASAAHPPPAVSNTAVPADIVAMLKEHRGRWRAEDLSADRFKGKTMDATWECKAAVGGVGNVCTWVHDLSGDRPPDSIEIMGYDPKLKMMSMTRLTDEGVIGTVNPVVSGNKMTRHWESTNDGKKLVGNMEIVIVKPGHWEQHITIDIDGKRTREIHLRQTRLE